MIVQLHVFDPALGTYQWQDITDTVLEVECWLGMTRGQRVASDGLVVRLTGPPPYRDPATLGVFALGQQIRVLSESLILLWIGHVASMTWLIGDDETVIEATTKLGHITDQTINPDRLVEVFSGHAVRAVLDRVAPPLYETNGLFIDRGSIDSQWIVDFGIWYSIDAGRIPLPYWGDQVGEGATAKRLLEDLALAEQGALYTSRNGITIFDDYDAWGKGGQDNSLSHGDGFRDVVITQGRDLVTLSRVAYYPRSVGPANTQLWQIENTTLRVPANSSRVVRCIYRDDDQQIVGVLSVDDPQGITANSLVDGTGLDLTSALVVDVLNRRGTLMEIKLTNTSNFYMYVRSMEIRGQPLLRGDRTLVAAAAWRSYDAYPREVSLDAGVISDHETAQWLADTLIKTHEEVVDQVVMSVDDNPKALACPIGSIITFSMPSWWLIAGQAGVVRREHHHFIRHGEHIVTLDFDWLGFGFGAGGTLPPGFSLPT